MKKRLISGCFTLLLALCLWTPAFAEARLYYVTDEAELLTEEENLALEENAGYLAEEYGLGVYIITVDDITDYVDAPDMISAAESLYLSYELGESDDQSGILLLLSMAERDYALFAFGYGNTAFTDYGKEYLAGKFLDEFGEDSWYEGFEDYQEACGEMVAAALAGTPVDVYGETGEDNGVYGVLACVGLGFLAAFLVRGLLKRQLKSVSLGDSARAFVAGEGLELAQHYDTYSHRTESRVYDPPEDRDSGGTTVRSSGGSGSSGKF